MFNPVARLRLRPPPQFPRPACTSDTPCPRPRPLAALQAHLLREKAALAADEDHMFDVAPVGSLAHVGAFITDTPHLTARPVSPHVHRWARSRTSASSS